MLVARDVDAYRAIDRNILTLVAEGRLAESGRALIDAYGREILGACIARMGEAMAGEDAAQDALARALTALPDYRGAAGLRPWLHRIAANRCVDLLRSRKSLRQRVVDGCDLELVAGPGETLPSERAENARAQQARLDAVRAALAEVKEPDRTWLELHYTHGVSYDDIADDAGLSRAAIKQRIWRAVKRVRALIGADDGGES